MQTLLFVCAILELVYCGCPDPGFGAFELVKDGECRGVVSKDSIMFDQATPQAIKRCAAIDGKPVIIHNEEHQSYWMNRAPPTSEGFVILGLVCNSKSKQWEWSDGSALDFKPPAGKYTLELDQPCVQGALRAGICTQTDIGAMVYLTKQTSMTAGNAGPVNVVIFCTTQLELPEKGADGCDDFADDAEDGVCYQVGATAESWQDAYMTCKKFGAELASIHNKQENAFLRRLAVARGAANGLFIGGSAKKDGTFGWMDGTPMDYENYYPGFPKKNFGDCLAMDTSSSAGQWMNTDCMAKLPVACIRAQHADVDPICSGEDYNEGAIITSPGYPFSASTTCDYFLAVDAGKRVEVEIISLEANTCCDSVKIYNGYLGAPLLAEISGEVANKTYTATSNIMRVSWQPDGGVNVKGLVMTYRAV